MTHYFVVCALDNVLRVELSTYGGAYKCIWHWYRHCLF